MFQGETAVTLDDKGRVSIPATHREAVSKLSGNRLVATYNPFEHGCLWLFPEKEWEQLRDEVNALSKAKTVHRNLQMKLVGAATPLEPDGNGRVLLPASQRTAAGLDKNARCIDGLAAIFRDQRLEPQPELSGYAPGGAFQAQQLEPEQEDVEQAEGVDEALRVLHELAALTEDFGRPQCLGAGDAVEIAVRVALVPEFVEPPLSLGVDGLHRRFRGKVHHDIGIPQGIENVLEGLPRQQHVVCSGDDERRSLPLDGGHHAFDDVG